MPVRVRPITLWRGEIDNQPGALAGTLEPLSRARVNLQVVMGYRLPGDRGRAAIEVAPVTGNRAASAAQAAGLQEAAISALLVEGDNRPGLGHAMARALGDAGINMDFLVGQVIGPRHTTVIGFDSREDAERAVPLIKAAAATPKAPARRAPARKSAPRARKGAARGRTPARKAARRR